MVKAGGVPIVTGVLLNKQEWPPDIEIQIAEIAPQSSTWGGHVTYFGAPGNTMRDNIVITWYLVWYQ